GVGTPAGDAVPVLDEEERVVDVKRDAEGNAVKSRLDEGLMRALARRTHGAYFPATRPGGDMPRLMSALGSVARAGRGQRLVERPVARFPWLAAAAALPLGIERGPLRRRREPRSEEHTSELQSRFELVCRLLLEKKKSIAWKSGSRTSSRLHLRMGQAVLQEAGLVLAEGCKSGMARRPASPYSHMLRLGGAHSRA